MGAARDNVELVYDLPAGEIQAVIQFRVHRGTPPIDERSPTFGEDALRALIQAAQQGDQTFTAAARALVGPWWDAWPQHHAAWRHLILLGRR